MSMNDLKLYWKLKRECGRNYWEQRILAQMDFLYHMFEAESEPLPDSFYEEADKLYKAFCAQGGLAEQNVRKAEEGLKACSSRAKKYKVICAAHAHMDMNWMWGMPETVGIVIDTFQTMLNLMEEYPDFIFSQSQVSTYEIIEKYAPSMLPAIRKRIQEGRWEVTASSWVEADKNMTGTEAMARHILYTKKYMQRLFGLEPDSLQIDFEPDTFGHSRHVPEILAKGGIKYYFHCRGNDQEEVYRWRAPSGKEILVYREPNWYLGPVNYNMTSFVPGFCRRNHTRTALCVYGVGDHGGGPTRRDLERIMDMRGWPLLPDIRFGTFLEFFRELDKTRDACPIVERELNFIFTGCYTSQSRLKAANRMTEDKLYDAEVLGAMEYLCGKAESSRNGLRAGWKHLLFNQFHDILPGSCVEDAVSYSLGKYQEALSYAVACANRSMKAVGELVDTSLLGEPAASESTSEGAGTGYNIMAGPEHSGQAETEGFQITETCRGRGNIRAYTLFNTTQYVRREPVEITLWDWPADLERTAVLDGEGNTVSFESLKENQTYWQHTFHKLLFTAAVPPFGYANYYICELEAPPVERKAEEPRVHRMEDGSYILENEKIRAVFASDSMKLTALTDKVRNKNLLDARGSGCFRYISEEDTEGMSAWSVGAYRKTEDLNETCTIRVTGQKLEGMRKWIAYRMDFYNSSLEVCVSLDDHADMLRYSIRADWHEIGRPGGTTPQLQFYAPFGYSSRQTRYDVPGGIIDRRAAGHDVPAVYFGAPLPEDSGSGLMVTTDSKYGYRTEDQAITINLLRSSHTPDPYPDQGVHRWELGMGVCTAQDWNALYEQAICFSHPIYAYSNSVHKGRLGQSQSWLGIDGKARITALKQTEDGSGLLLRYYNCGNEKETLTIKSHGTWDSISRSNLMEEEVWQLCREAEEMQLIQEPHALDSVRIVYGKHRA